MNCIDLTLSDEEDDIVLIKTKITEQYNSNKPRSSQIDKDVYSYFYGTEDRTQEFLAMQHPVARKVVRNNYTIRCPRCQLNFTNCNFLNHIIDHYNMDLHHIDNLVIPQLTNDTMPNQEWHAVKCEICDLKFTSLITLGQHLKKKHVYKDMPYVCFACNVYRTSFLSELLQHFSDHHKSTQYLVCPVCIETFELQRVNHNEDVLDAAAFVAHLDRHMTKSRFSCDKCVLKFFSKTDLVYHRTVYHEGQTVPDDDDDSKIGEDMVGRGPKLVKKSLNVSSQSVDIAKLTINGFRLPYTCAECNEHLAAIGGHYQSYVMCPLCGFSSYCSASFRRHTRTMHGQSTAEMSAHSTVDVFNDGVLLCPCGYQSLHGDKVARHMVSCQHQVCHIKRRLYIPGSGDNVLPLSKSEEFFKVLKLQKISLPSD